MTELTLTHSPAIVTSASRGIGRQIATTFAAAGGEIAICSRSYDDVEPVAEEITAEHEGRVVPVECDVTEHRVHIASRAGRSSTDPVT